MSAQQNKAIVRRFFDEVCNGRKLKVADELFADDFTYHAPASVSPGGTGPDAIKQELSTYHRAFPDARWTVHAMLAAEDDTVVVRWRGEGTHDDELNGIPPTGKRVSVEAIDLFQLRNGQIIENWEIWDALAMMQQLGLAPTMGTTVQRKEDGSLADMTPDSAALIHGIYDAYNRRDFDYAARLTHRDAELRNIPTGDVFHGPEGHRALQQGWATAFPDSRVEITSMVASGDQVVVEFMGRGTHTGPLQTPTGEVAPTNRYIEVPFCDVWQLRNGKVSQSRSYFDLATMMHQLGLTTEAGATGAKA